MRQAKAAGLPVTCDVSINSLHLTENDIGYFDSSARLTPPLRQQRDRDALSQALRDGTIDALVSDHTPVDEDAKALPFAEAEPGANLAAGEQFQAVVPAGCWFGAELAEGDFALVGCTVAPGFDFADFELAQAKQLLACYPQHAELIHRLTRA